MAGKYLHILMLISIPTLSPAVFAQDSNTQKIVTKKPAEKDYRHYIQAGYQIGYVLPMNDFIEGDNAAGEPITSLQSGRLEFGWQTTGSQRWHQIWNYPSFGIGHTTMDYFNEDEVGTPSAIYGFVSLPIKRWDRWSFNIAPGFGVSYGWKPFDPISNPYNQSTGAFRAAFIDINSHFTYIMNPHWDLLLALPAYHFSNGGSRKPNNGFNQVGAMMSVRYKIEADPRHFKHWDDIPKYERSDEIVVTGSWGLRNVNFGENANVPPELEHAYARADFNVITLSATWLRQTSYKSRWGAGIDLVRDESTSAQIDLGEGNIIERNIDGFDQTRVGLYGAYEYVIRDFAIVGHVGYTVYQKGFDGQLPRPYQRVGFRYSFQNDWLIGLSVRLKDFSSADYLEWTVGHRFRI